MELREERLRARGLKKRSNVIIPREESDQWGVQHGLGPRNKNILWKGRAREKRKAVSHTPHSGSTLG